MKKKLLKISLTSAVLLIAVLLFVKKTSVLSEVNPLNSPDVIENKKDSREEKYRFAEERQKHEINYQVDPRTGRIPYNQ